MRKKIEFVWEELDKSTRRVKVIGGWIVQCKVFEEGKKGVMISESSVFIMDRDHEWTIVQPIVETVSEKKVSSSDYEVCKKDMVHN